MYNFKKNFTINKTYFNNNKIKNIAQKTQTIFKPFEVGTDFSK